MPINDEDFKYDDEDNNYFKKRPSDFQIIDLNQMKKKVNVITQIKLMKMKIIMMNIIMTKIIQIIQIVRIIQI